MIKSNKENLNDNLEAITNLINEDEKGIWVFLGDEDTKMVQEIPLVIKIMLNMWKRELGGN